MMQTADGYVHSAATVVIIDLTTITTHFTIIMIDRLSLGHFHRYISAIVLSPLGHFHRCVSGIVASPLELFHRCVLGIVA